jgi:hypothetical protein
MKDALLLTYRLAECLQLCAFQSIRIILWCTSRAAAHFQRKRNKSCQKYTVPAARGISLVAILCNFYRLFMQFI